MLQDIPGHHWQKKWVKYKKFPFVKVLFANCYGNSPSFFILP